MKNAISPRLRAAIRRELDERQAYQRLKIQALVGRVLGLAVGNCLHRGLGRQGQALGPMRSCSD